MSPLEQIEAIFHEALTVSPEQRLEWLREFCGNDPAVFAEVCSLLEARAAMQDEIVHPENISPERLPQDRAIPRDLFGRWKAVRLIGQGGMSSVYLAERVDGQFEQRVALKIMAGYLTDPEFLRRFETEQRLLASLNHRNITRLLDGGVSSSGEPFLITEYVDGDPVDRWCDANKLNISERIRIFLQVCDAVDYAHRNLIVHRDLKPANILVDRQGEVRLLDFGTAALLAGQYHPALTRTRMVTPRYASPEQLRGERVNIATDVFSLGVILYELTTAASPFGESDSILSELDRATGRRPPQLPTAVLTAEAAHTRSSSLPHLRRAIHGDLSAILLKALDPEQNNRYASVAALAADLHSFLLGEPITARPQTGWYRAARFLRRQWLPVTAAALFIAGISGAAFIAAWQARAARAEARKAENVNGFLNNMLSSSSHRDFDPRTFTVVRMLDSAEAHLAQGWKGDPRTEADLRLSLGTSYLSLMVFDRAQAQLDQARHIFSSLHDRQDTGWALFRLAELAAAEGHSADAVRRFEEVLGILNGLGSDAPPRLVFGTKDELGNELSLIQNRRLDDARRYLDEAIALGTRDSSIPRSSVAVAMAHRAILLQNAGKRREAEVMYREALATGRREDPGGFWQAGPLFGLATLIAPTDPAGAAELSRQRYELLHSRLGEDHPETAVSKILWARQRADAGDPGQAPQQVLDAIEIVRRGFSASSMDRWFALSSSAHVLNKARRYREAEALSREMLPILDANHLADNDARRAESFLELGKALRGEKKDRAAAEALARAAAIYDAAGPWAAPMASWVRQLLSEIQ